MFGFEIIESGFLLSALIAFLAGAISFLSPCVLPIVPPYLAYISGVNITAMAQPQTLYAHVRTIHLAIVFVLGLSTIFIFLGASASFLGGLLLANQQLFTQIAGIAIIIMGLNFLGLFRLAFLGRELRWQSPLAGGSAIGAYFLGLAFAFGWTPCIGPQLGAILAIAAQDSSVLRGSMLLGLYALGLGLPFIITALFFHRAQNLIKWSRPHMRKIEIFAGGFLILIGIMMFQGSFAALSYWLLETFPIMQNIG